MFNNFPYTDVHQLNLDWIIKQVKENSEKIDHFIIDTDAKIQEDVNNWLDAHPEATTTVLDGAITFPKLNSDMVDAMRVWINVKSMAPGYDLNNSTIAQAILDALAVSKYIYIPAGDYTFNVEISQDAYIILDDQAYISTDNADPCIYAHDCSLVLIGGNVYAGENDDTRVPVYWSDTQSIEKSIIQLTNCHDCLVSGMQCDHSKYAAVFRTLDCENVTFENLRFDNILLQAISVRDYNKNIVVRNCSFTHLKKITGHDYCYAVSTGVTNYSDNTIVPPDGFIVENCYVNGSEDCAIDTHGARNVIFRNNKVLQTVCALTAYNDNRRAIRPSGWHMENILIENNYCESDKNNEPGRQYPHPFIFLGGSNYHTVDEPEYYLNPGNYYAYCNCIVQNNYFKSANTYANGTVMFNQVCRNLAFNNNIVDSCGVNRPGLVIRGINVEVRNNKFLNVSAGLGFEYSKALISNNDGGRIYSSSINKSCVEGLIGAWAQGGASHLLAQGQIYDDSGTLKMSKSYGIRVRPSLALPAAVTITVTDGVAELTDHNYIPGLYLKLTDGGGNTTSAYVKDVIDMKHFELANINTSTPTADGTYSAEQANATVTSL